MRILRATYRTWLIGCLFLLPADVTMPQPTSRTAEAALDLTVHGTSAIAVVLDVGTGHLLAVARSHEAAELRSSPGSTLKPFFLASALERGQIQPQSTVFCQKPLSIAQRDVSCTHPQNQVSFDAEQALAYSCNRYFAELAKRFSPEQAVAILKRYGLTEQPRIFLSEASAVIQTPVTTDQTELFVLGLEGSEVTPAQLAEGYRKLALQLNNLPAGSPLHTVEHGLQDSVQYGMAHNAQITGLSVAGKTGTASDPGQPWTHGWFAGFAPSDMPKIVIVVYLPRGNGADAAHLAQKFFSAYKEALLR